MPKRKDFEFQGRSDVRRDRHTSKGKGELEERNGGSTTRAEAMGHNVDI